MKKILVVLMLLGPPAGAQYAHTSNPGVIGNVKPTITTNGQCATVASGGSNSAMFAVTGTWTGTLGFFGSNDNGATTIALQAYAITPGTGAVATSSVNTTTGNGVWLADTWGTYQTEVCATAAMTGTATLQLDAMPAVAIQQITGLGGGPVTVTGSLSVSGAADVVSTGAPTTFNANAVCTGTLLTAGLQSAGFHFDVGTLIGTFTAQCSAFVSGTTNFTNGGLKDVTGATVSGAVTNPNAQTDWTITCPGDTRRVQVCTTAFTSGSTTGQAVGTFYQTASAAGGGGGGPATQSTAGTNAQAWWVRIGDATNGPAAVKAASAAAVATDPALVCAISPNNTVALVANQSMNEAQINGVAPSMGNGVSGTGVQRVTIASDSTGQVAVAGSVNIKGLGTANSPDTAVVTCQPPSGSTIPYAIYTPGATTIAANAADNAAVAATLNAACTTTTACSAASSIQWPMNGNQGATLTLTTSTSAVGTSLACDQSWDGVSGAAAGITYLLNSCDMWQLHGAYRKGALTNADAIAAATAVQQWQIYAPGSPSHIRIRMATFTSGSVVAVGRGTMAPNLPFPIWARPQTPPTVVTLTASTAETTLVAAGGSGVFLDLLDLSCTNSSASSNVITVRDTTGGTARKPIICPAAIGPCEGWAFPNGLQQTSSNANWTVQAASSTSSVLCTATAVQR